MVTRHPQNAGSTHPAAPPSAANTFHGPETKVTFDPPNKVFFITADARIPKIKASCQLPNLAPAVSGQSNSPWAEVQGYDWDVTVVLNPAGVPDAVGRSTSHIPIRFTTLVPELTLPFTQIRGGTLSVVVATTLQGQRVTGKAVAEIRGTNPSTTLIRAEAVPEILMKLMKLESSLRQFRTTHSRAGYPVFSHDGFGGVGLGQITHPRPTDDEVWDWKANVKAAKAQWESKSKNDAKKNLQNYASGSAFRELVRQYNQNRVRTAQLKPLTVTLPSVTDEMLENEAIRLYNGAPRPNGHSLQEYTAEVDENGWLVVDAAPDNLHGAARWQEVTAASRTAFYDSNNLERKYRGDPDYVNHVRSQVVP
jgi:hypothetical protein